MEYVQSWVSANPVEVAAALLIAAYVLIATEALSKSVIALLGACIAIILGLVSQSKNLPSGAPNPEYFVNFIDFNVIFLLIAMMIINAHKCTEEFMWQNVKDPKVVNEVLNDFERIPNRYLSTVCHFTNYLTFTEVQIMLNLSEKQAKRFGRFYEKCKWQAKKEEGKRGKHTDNYGL